MWLGALVSSFVCIQNAATLAELWPLWGFVIWLFALWVATLLHELGHATATWLCGWRVAAIAVGPIGFHFFNRDFALIPRSKRPETSGFVLPTPSNPHVWTRGRQFVITAGGPLTSLLLGGLLVLIALPLRNPVFDYTIDMHRVALGFGLLSLATAVVTLFPSSWPTRLSDGQRLLTYLREDDGDWRRTRAVVHLYGLLYYQVRLRDLPLWIVNERLNASNERRVQQAYDSMLIGIVLDTLPVDKAEARKLLDQFRMEYGASAWLDSCDAYFTAVWEGDGERARDRLWEGEAQEEMKPMLFAADAAVQASLGDAARMRMSLRQMRDAVRKRSLFPDATFRDIGRQIEALLPAKG